jgi:hypothetical protein
MGVEIDETRSHGQAVCIDHTAGAAAHSTDFGDPIADNGDVSHTGRQSTAVVNPAISDD